MQFYYDPGITVLHAMSIQVFRHLLGPFADQGFDPVHAHGRQLLLDSHAWPLGKHKGNFGAHYTHIFTTYIYIYMISYVSLYYITLHNIILY